MAQETLPQEDAPKQGPSKERIFVTYSNATASPRSEQLFGEKLILGHHKAINYIDKTGQRFVIEGVPEHRSSQSFGKALRFLNEELLSTGRNRSDSEFGRLQMQAPDAILPENVGNLDTDPYAGLPEETIAIGEDLSQTFKGMRDAMAKHLEKNYEYRPLTQNSNSIVDEVIKDAGLPPLKQVDDTGVSRSAPGSHNGLHNPGATPSPENSDQWVSLGQTARRIAETIGDAFNEMVGIKPAHAPSFKEIVSAQGGTITVEYADGTRKAFTFVPDGSRQDKLVYEDSQRRRISEVNFLADKSRTTSTFNLQGEVVREQRHDASGNITFDSKADRQKQEAPLAQAEAEVKQTEAAVGDAKRGQEWAEQQRNAEVSNQGDASQRLSSTAANFDTKTQDTQGPNLLHVVGSLLDGVGSLTGGILGGLGSLLGGTPAQEKVTKKQQEAEERRLQAQADQAKRDADQEALLKKLQDVAFEVMYNQGTFNDMVASETIFADEDKPAEKGDAEQPVPGQPGRGRPKVGIPPGTLGSDRGGFMDKQGPLIGLEKKTDHKAEIPATQPNNQCSGVPGAASLADGSTLLSPICIDAEPPEDDVPGVPYVDNDAPDKQADTKAETDRLKAERAAQEAAAKAAAEAAQQAADEQRRRADEARRQREQNLRDAQERQRQMQEQSRREAEERRRQAAADQARRQAEADRLQREMASIRIPGSGGGRRPAPGAPTPAHRPSLPPSRTWFGVPVVLDLNNDNGLDIRPLADDAKSIASVRDHHPGGGTEAAEAASIGPAFDWNGDGTQDPTAWVGPDDGLLAIDLAADGTAGPDKQINQAPEIAFALWKTEDERQAELKALGIDDTGRPVTDLEGLRFAFDTNKDNVLDNRDARWSEFRIWQDANQNGVAEDSELQTLDDLGIKLINLIPSPDGSKVFADGSAITGTGTAQKTDGSSLLIGDVTLAYRPSAFG
ncbi:hypothetical protein [Agrobacterium tumefaciens]|uniref:hypothetical protein n=1 Tax=Agrobacterium tumefaciens TaxID=358 RepID=UPI0021CF2BC6|nr:hypothetical protein [Agrobacterium tumefaciens]UXS05585.1 hypothetical protein FY156_29115 [Agrobacterium tumefaciens]